ncbi:MAG: hypothetical protein AAF628_15515 [Planctomycetota bacterium]
MRHPLNAIAPLALLAAATAPIAAQDDPNGFPLHLHTFEGDSSSTTILNQPYIRWQQIDSTTNFSHIVKFFNLRRDGHATATNAVSRNVDVELRMGYLQNVAAFSNDFKDNYNYLSVLDTETTIVPRTTISLPDWSQIPLNRPSGFKAVPPTADTLVLPTIFHSYPGVGPTVWDLQVWNTTTGGDHPVDYVNLTGDFHSGARHSGVAGCSGMLSTGFWDVQNFGASCSMTLGASSAPPGEIVFGLLGLSNPGIPFPFLCAPLQSDVLIGSFPAGIVGPTGDASGTLNIGPYSPTWQFFKIHMQAIAAPSLTLGDGVEMELPQTVAMGEVEIKHIFTTTMGSATGMGVTDGGVVFEIVD